jgi:hypothetical protein
MAPRRFACFSPWFDACLPDAQSSRTGMISEANQEAIEAAGLSFILGMKTPDVPYLVDEWRRQHPARTSPTATSSPSSCRYRPGWDTHRQAGPERICAGLCGRVTRRLALPGRLASVLASQLRPWWGERASHHFATPAADDSAGVGGTRLPRPAQRTGHRETRIQSSRFLERALASPAGTLTRRCGPSRGPYGRYRESPRLFLWCC